MDKGQREYFLRQQMKAIQEELGEVDETQAEANELREQIEAADLPEHAREVAERELAALRAAAAAVAGARRDPQLPRVDRRRCRGRSRREDDLDLKKARKVLDRDHYDIEKVKDRILEFLAVRKLKPDARSSILCFVGPPGVGKTSLGQLDRRGDGPQVRAHLGRRRARRVGDPRPPAHLRRRDARHDHPGAARRRRRTTRC